jgi:hypothetical protein
MMNGFCHTEHVPGDSSSLIFKPCSRCHVAPLKNHAIYCQLMDAMNKLIQGNTGQIAVIHDNRKLCNWIRQSVATFRCNMIFTYFQSIGF